MPRFNILLQSDTLTVANSVHSMKGYTRRSFTLTEVLVAIILVGGLLGVFLPALKGAFEVYRTVEIESTSQYLADEYFSQAIISSLSKAIPKDFEKFSQTIPVKVEDVDYTVSIKLVPAEEEDEKEKKNASFLELHVSISLGKDELNHPIATRETVLCLATQK